MRWSIRACPDARQDRPASHLTIIRIGLQRVRWRGKGETPTGRMVGRPSSRKWEIASSAATSSSEFPVPLAFPLRRDAVAQGAGACRTTIPSQNRVNAKARIVSIGLKSNIRSAKGGAQQTNHILSGKQNDPRRRYPRDATCRRFCVATAVGASKK